MYNDANTCAAEVNAAVEKEVDPERRFEEEDDDGEDGSDDEED